MDFEAARDAFCKLKDELDKEHLADFFTWIQHAFLTAYCRGENPAIANRNLQDIANYIKGIVPLHSILPSESISSEAEKEENPAHTVHVDAFLYDDCEIDDLVAEGKLSRNYCLDCHSHSTAPLNYITHSISRQRLDFVFSGFIPYQNSQKVILDVGSRLGAFLYGAYYHSEAGQIVGVEMNSELCEVQKKVVEKYSLGDRIRVICNDIRNELDIVCSADVVLLNNVFEYFLPPQEQVSCWRFLARNIKAGAIILSIPGLEDSLKDLNTGINLSAWVRKRLTSDPLFAMTIASHDELSEVTIYDVIEPFTS